MKIEILYRTEYKILHKQDCNANNGYIKMNKKTMQTCAKYRVHGDRLN